ncbi:MAG: hypothetical protein NTW78_06195 [Campylobacterales bacterium]|nr:hypothetical protein [Campylobacterales bacterium]
MSNINNTNTMVSVKVASKELGEAKGKIKDMIKDGEISFELVNGIYMVNIEEIKKVIEEKSFCSNSIGKFKCSDTFIRIAKITLNDFKVIPYNHNTDGIISDMSNIIKTKHITMFNIQNIIPYIFSCGRYKKVELMVLKNPSMVLTIDNSKEDSIGIEHFYMLNEIRNNFTITNPINGVFIIDKK